MSQVDSLYLNKSYNEIYQQYIKTYEDTIKSKRYLNFFLNKAVREKVPIRQAQALTHLSYYSKDAINKIRLLDKAIAISEKLDFIGFPELSLTFKAGYYINVGEYEEGLTILLNALRISEKKGNTEYIYIIKHNIASVKNEIGKHNEALDLYRECDNYENTKPLSDQTLDYYRGLVDISDCYIKNKKLDSASLYVQKGIKHAKNNDNDLYARFLIMEGIILYYKNDFESSKKRLNTGLSIIDKQSQYTGKVITQAYYFLGKNSKLLGQELTAILHYKKVDFLILKNGNYLPEFREAYTFMVDYYENELENKLEALNKLLKFDSIVNQNIGKLSEQLIKTYDTPVLIKEKDELVNELKNGKTLLKKRFVLIIVLSIIIVVVLIINNYNKLRYKRDFNKLINDGEIKNSEIKQISKNTLKINIEIIENILKMLDEFESKNKFLNSKLNISFLATDFKTNQKYLSQVINHYKQKNFTNYINDLRINFVIEKLNTDLKLRKYTIESIAKEVGFNSSESFSSAFVKKTKIRPSYFIRELNQLKREE